MKEIFIKHKMVILRGLGVLLLLGGFLVQFWVTPKKAFTENEIAAQNVARMEARVAKSGGGSAKKQKSSSAEVLEHLKQTQQAQLKYLTMISMAFGVGFLGYSLIQKKD